MTTTRGHSGLETVALIIKVGDFLIILGLKLRDLLTPTKDRLNCGVQRIACTTMPRSLNLTMSLKTGLIWLQPTQLPLQWLIRHAKVLQFRLRWVESPFGNGTSHLNSMQFRALFADSRFHYRCFFSVILTRPSGLLACATLAATSSFSKATCNFNALIRSELLTNLAWSAPTRCPQRHDQVEKGHFQRPRVWDRQQTWEARDSQSSTPL